MMKIVSEIKRQIKGYLLKKEAKGLPVSNQRGYSKVFVIGFNKTGTTTLYNTLKGLQFKMGDQRVAEVLTYFMYKNNDFTELEHYCITAEAFQDVPFSFPQRFKKFHKLYPDAKFILTIRDSSEQWYNSLVNFHRGRFQKKGNELPTIKDYMRSNYVFPGSMIPTFKNIFNYPEIPLFHKEHYINVYEKHIDDVKVFFKDKQDKLLIINVSKSGERKRLLEFLKVKPSRFLSSDFSRFKKTKRT